MNGAVAAISADSNAVLCALAAAAEDFGGNAKPMDSAPPLLPPTDEPRPQETFVCKGCKSHVAKGEETALKEWCKTCFDKELSSSKSPELVAAQTFLCHGYKTEVELDRKGCLKGWCQSCFDRELASRQVDKCLAHQESTKEEKEPLAAADLEDPSVATPPSSGKLSLCTWWQRVKAEEGIGKAEALNQWKGMPQKEREFFKQSISHRIGAPTPSPKASVSARSVDTTPSPAKSARITSLDEFEKKWATLRKGLQTGKSAREFFLQNPDDGWRLYVDVVSWICLM